MTRSRWLVAPFGAVLVLVTLIIGAGAARAQDGYPPTPSCTASLSSSQTVDPGQAVTIVGSAFPSNTTVTAVLHAQHSYVLGTAHTDTTGAFHLVAVLPDTVPPGDHEITVRPGVGCSPAHARTGTGAPLSVPNTPAFTGVQSRAILVLALSALLIGSLVLFAGRRRKS